MVLLITAQFNSRNARIRAKIKELFASANDSLPQYYIDAVLGGPSYANVLSWEFNNHKEDLFNGNNLMKPIVDLGISRNQALERFSRIK